MVKPSKTIFLLENTIPQKEDIILLYIGYHSIPKSNATHLFVRNCGLAGSSLENISEMRLRLNLKAHVPITNATSVLSYIMKIYGCIAAILGNRDVSIYADCKDVKYDPHIMMS